MGATALVNSSRRMTLMDVCLHPGVCIITCGPESFNADMRVFLEELGYTADMRMELDQNLHMRLGQDLPSTPRSNLIEPVADPQGDGPNGTMGMGSMKHDYDDADLVKEAAEDTAHIKSHASSAGSGSFAEAGSFKGLQSGNAATYDDESTGILKDGTKPDAR